MPGMGLNLSPLKPQNRIIPKLRPKNLKSYNDRKQDATPSVEEQTMIVEQRNRALEEQIHELIHALG